MYCVIPFSYSYSSADPPVPEIIFNPGPLGDEAVEDNSDPMKSERVYAFLRSGQGMEWSVAVQQGHHADDGWLWRHLPLDADREGSNYSDGFYG